MDTAYYLTMPLYVTQEFNHLGYTLHLPSTGSLRDTSTFPMLILRVLLTGLTLQTESAMH